MTNLRFRDLAVVAKIHNGDLPIGEAPGRGELFSLMQDDERQGMCSRLENCIVSLMDYAHNDHLDYHIKNALDVNSSEVITRLSTNEFFFILKNH